jgi:hypothetical protein
VTVSNHGYLGYAVITKATPKRALVVEEASVNISEVRSAELAVAMLKMLRGKIPGKENNDLCP